MTNKITLNDIRQMLHNTVPHLSFSSVSDFLNDRAIWKKKWVDLNWGGTEENLIEGKAYHAGMELFWNRMPEGGVPGVEVIDEMMEAARTAIDEELMQIEDEEELKEVWKWQKIAKKNRADFEADGYEIEDRVDKAGKNVVYARGAVEQLMSRLEEDMNRYVSTGPEPYAKVIGVEIKAIAETADEDTGKHQLCATKGRIDRVDFDEATGTMYSIDYKHVGRKPDTDDEGLIKMKPGYIMQAACYESLKAKTAKECGIDPEKIKEFRCIIEYHVKGGEVIAAEFTVGKKEKLAWSRILKGVIFSIAMAEFMPEGIESYLPNPNKAFDQDGWDHFMGNIAEELGKTAKTEVRRLTIEQVEALDL